MKKFILKFLWLEKSIAVALDQSVNDKITPVTEYFFWPRKDAWEEMKLALEMRPWISQTDSVLLLNQITEVINYWQEKGFMNIKKKDMELLKNRFPDCIFIGYD
uniref:Small ribosomal subunit protein cS23 n=1 Tax=Discoplastis spathirhyncha TaxID=215771 RepID=A0A3G3LLC5_9EUGL|nr:putative ribosomal protein 3 [Discoplastis spathirhyncha]AYQ93510.1 putative ribosomal protein 3 [Discoplastis spathirhyncha]